MKAVVQRRYGPPRAVYSLAEVDRPAPRRGQVLVEVRATSVHADVWHMATGRPLMLRLMGGGLLRPRVGIPGTDMAGVVVEVGTGVDSLSAGDRVFGETIKGIQWKNGAAFAEFVAVDQTRLRLVPAGVSFQAAASVPTSGLIAWRTMTEEGRVQAGDEVLINGAGGAVGTVALQIAKARGARVVVVDRAEKLAMLSDLGADHTIDYLTEDFTASGETYNIVYDIPGNRSLEDLKRVVGPGGRYVLVGHDEYGGKGARVFGSAVPKYIRIAARRPFGTPADVEAVRSDDPLSELAQMLASGSLTPPIGAVYSLDNAVEAMEALASGIVPGKIVLTPAV